MSLKDPTWRKDSEPLTLLDTNNCLSTDWEIDPGFASTLKGVFKRLPTSSQSMVLAFKDPKI